MLAKLAAWGSTRDQAIHRLRDAIARFAISGIRTNLAFFLDILADPDFRSGAIHTGFIADWLARRTPPTPTAQQEIVAALVATLASLASTAAPAAPTANGASSPWRATGRSTQLR